MALAQEKIYTIDDIYDLPNGQRAELIDGQMYMMAPPRTMHQRISSVLHVSIFQHIKSKGGSLQPRSSNLSLLQITEISGST